MNLWSNIKHYFGGYHTVPKNVVMPKVFVGDMESILMYYTRKDYTPMITKDYMKGNPNAVFVFGSNTEGRHGGGAAVLAHDLGCPYGFGEGYHAESQTYALPTLDFTRKYGDAKVPFEDLSESLAKFFDVADAHPDKTFYLTEIGTGLGGWTREDVMNAIWAGAI